MKKVICFIFALMFLLPVDSMGQIKGTSKDGLISWTLSDDGTLTIAGQGVFSGSILRDIFRSHGDKIYSINRIVINPGITAITGFDSQRELNVTSVSLPNTLKVIGNRAFSAYKLLRSIIIPASVNVISTAAFYRWECRGNKLEEIIVDSNNTKYKSINGILYDYDVKTLICCPSSYKGEVNIPGTVETIGDEAFHLCFELTNVKFPDNLKTIKQSAFAGCFKLTNVILPDSLKTIEERAFWGCIELSTITIPNSLTELNPKAFSGCDKLRKAYVPENWEIAADNSLFPENCAIIHHK